MPNRRIYVILFAVVLVAVVLVAVIGRSRDREPEYGGKRLSEWVGRYLSSSDSHECDDAIRRIGTNALPWLMKWISYDPPRWKTKIYASANSIISSLNSDWSIIDEKERRSFGVFLAFDALGSQAKPAIPELTRRLNNGNAVGHAQAAASLLSAIGNDGLLPLLQVVTNRERPSLIRNMALLYIGFATNTPITMPILSNLLEDPEPYVRDAATKALSDMEARALRKSQRATQLRKKREESDAIGGLGR
jgi:hypothetical protein